MTALRTWLARPVAEEPAELRRLAWRRRWRRLRRALRAALQVLRRCTP